MALKPRLWSRPLAAGTLSLLALLAQPARAGGSVRAEAAVALPLSMPQRAYYTPGGQGVVQVSWELASPLDVTAGVTYAILPPTPDRPVELSGPGAMAMLAAGARLKRPLSDATFVPYLEVLAGYTGTGPLGRLGLQGAAGLGWRWNPGLPLLVGPYLRYAHVFASPEPGFTSHDLSLLSIGLNVELLFAQHAGSFLPPPDTDRDGVGDETDQCVTVPGPVANAGCPLKQDSDEDGILDPEDRCPTEREDRDGFEDTDGCPEPDNDRDGVLDSADKCPDLAGKLPALGCPDADDDTVADAVDQCPNKPGSKETAGCPLYRSVKVTESRLELSQRIFFAFGKAEILRKSFALLDEVVTALADRSRLCVRVEGHTDAKGSSAKNKELSQERAASVRNYLVEHGIEPSRLNFEGFGDTEPLDDNRTSEGREKNRRVEFVIISCQGGPP